MIDGLRVAIPVLATAAEGKFANYYNALRAAGATPIPVSADVDPGAFGGLLLPGGGDIAPERYGQADVACRCVDADLDALQFGALAAFVNAKKPVLAICRGHQLVNVFFGGALIQNLPRAEVHSRCGAPRDRVHATTADRDSAIFRLYGERPSVNSNHHQGVDRLGKGLRAIQRSDDGVIEGMEHEELPILCVQWHPERMCLNHARPDTVDGLAVFRCFVGLCGDVNV